MFSLLSQKSSVGFISIVVNGQILKKNLTIQSHIVGRSSIVVTMQRSSVPKLLCCKIIRQRFTPMQN